MRKAKYSAKSVNLPNASLLGFGIGTAKPGNWVTFTEDLGTRKERTGRVLGRIDETESRDCRGFLAVMTLSDDMTYSFVRWVNPKHVVRCVERAPAKLLAWITGDEWPTRATEIPRMIAMAYHGTCSEQFIDSRNEPDKAYNARPEYVAEFTLE